MRYCVICKNIGTFYFDLTAYCHTLLGAKILAWFYKMRFDSIVIKKDFCRRDYEVPDELF